MLTTAVGVFLGLVMFACAGIIGTVAILVAVRIIEKVQRKEDKSETAKEISVDFWT